MMRIIAGTHRGRKVFSIPKDVFVKPISARIRQSVFDIIRPKITGSCFLDLFAGCGTVGLEALSRGAERTVFVEKAGICLKTIERNVKALGFEDKAKVLKADILEGLKWLEHYSDYQGYDIIFMGPPYRTDTNEPLAYSMKTLENIRAGGILKEDGIAVVQHHVKEEVGSFPGLELYRREKYGDSFVDFFRREK